MGGGLTTFSTPYDHRRRVVFFYYPKEIVSAESQDELLVRVKQITRTERCLISFLWSANGILSLVDVLKGESYNSAFFCNGAVLSLVENVCLHSRRRWLKALCVHLDNAGPHNSRLPNDGLQATKARWMEQRAYNSDPAPSEFFLFGFRK
jgi:hypothetical protein